MFQAIIGMMFRPRHFWRTVSFDEIAELYASRLLTVFAQNVINLFAAVYLYKMGYSLQFIALYYAGIYAMKIPVAFLAGKVTAYFGPKHAVLYGNLMRIPSLICFALAESAGLPAVIMFGVFQGISVVLYDIGYSTDFSKIHNARFAGKELGTMQLIEKIARVVSPLVGGMLAAFWSPEVVIILAAVLFSLAALPLFRTVEPTVVKAKMKISGFPWRLAWGSLVAQTAVGIDFVSSAVIWTLFITTIVFAFQDNSIYAALGALASMGVLVSIVASWGYGALIDRKKATLLVYVGAFGNALIHLFRPFVNAAPGVIATNIASETATSAYTISLMRIGFDIADTSGFRITYMTLVEMAINVGAALTCLLWAILIGFLGAEHAFSAMFLVAAVGVLLLVFARSRR